MKLKLRPTELLAWLKAWPRWRWIVAVAILATIGAYSWHNGGATTAGAAAFAARRGPLNITVLEGGSIRAVDSQEIKCEVRVGYQGIKILKIVEEGYEVIEATEFVTHGVLRLLGKPSKPRGHSAV